MKNNYIIFLMIVLLLLSGCSVEQPVIETETISPTQNLNINVSIADLNQLYLDNEFVFNNMIKECENFAEDVYCISIKNKKICFSNDIGQEVSLSMNLIVILF